MSAAAEHTHYPINPASFSRRYSARVTNMTIVASLSQSYVLILDFFVHYRIIGSSNHFTKQCHGPNSLSEDCHTILWQKGSKSLSISSLSTTPSLHLGGLTTATSCFCSRHPIPSNHSPGKVPRQRCGQSRIAPDCGRQLFRRHF